MSGFKITQPRTAYVALVSNAGNAGNADGIGGTAVCVTAPTTGDVLTFNGTEWCPAVPTASALTIKDEGTPLATAATSLDFVGAGVTATGSGAAKTITIPGASASILPFLFATDYGVIADNTTNNDATLAAWIAAGIALGGAIMVLPVGSCKITVPLAVSPGSVCTFQFLGAGLGSAIRQATANTSGMTFNANAAGSVLENFIVQGPAGAGGSGATTSIGVSGDVHTINMTVLGFFKSLAIPSTSFYSKHYRSFFYNARSAVELASGSNNSEFIACRAQLAVYGYDILGAQSVKILGGSVEGNTTAGIRANGSTNQAGLDIEGVYFEQADGVPDILLGDATAVYGTTIKGCTHVKSAYSGTGWAVDAPNAVGLVYIGGSIDSSDAIRVNTSSTACTIVQPYLRNAGTVTIPAGSIYIRGGTTTVALGIGTAAHGASSELAPIDHVHPLGTPTVGGDLSGTLPNPTVAKINGVAVTGTPALGDEIVATSSTTATWQTPATIPVLPPAHVHVDNLTFSGDGATTDFELPASPVDAFSVAAYVAGVRTAITVSGAILTNMNFAVAPVSGTDNIIVDIAAALA